MKGLSLRVAASALAFAGVLALASASKEVRHLTAADFEDVVGDNKVHLIKFYAPWCGHCRRLAPTWKELAAAYEGSDRVSIESVDCTSEKELCGKHEVRGYPTLKVFFNGEAKDAYKGARDLDSLKSFADKQATVLLDETVA